MCQAPEWDTNTPFGPSSEIPPCMESPVLPLEDDTLIHKSLCVSLLSEWSIVTPNEERQKRLSLMEVNEDGLGDSLTFTVMFRARALVHCQSGTRNGQSREDAFALIPAVGRECRISHRVPSAEGKACGRAGHGPRGPAISVFGCGSLASLCRAPLSALRHEKLFWCGCWWGPTY